MKPLNLARYVKYSVQKYMRIYANVIACVRSLARSHTHFIHGPVSNEGAKKEKRNKRTNNK